MNLSKLYTNKPEVLSPIVFNKGLSVVLAEIQLPENQAKDTHNLGKTTLGRLLDFTLLSKKDGNFFLFKHDRFQDFVFFLELELGDGKFLTVRRCVASPTKIAFKKHSQGDQDFTELKKWDHQDMPFERAKETLDGLLDWQGLKGWSFRQVLSYLLRTQEDFQDPFHLQKFRGKHSEWKPFLAFLLGLNGKLVELHYEKQEALKALQDEEKRELAEFGGTIEDSSTIGGLLLIKSRDLEKKQQLLEALDFRDQDKEKTAKLVDEIDARIARLNEQRYALAHTIKRIENSLKSGSFSFDTDEAKQVFEEAGIHFGGQLKKDFDTLISFNKAISVEREGYLRGDLKDHRAKLQGINEELNHLGLTRSNMLSFLKSSDVWEKFKLLSDEIVEQRAEIETLRNKQSRQKHLQEVRKQLWELKNECDDIERQIEVNIEEQSAVTTSTFSKIRVYFNEIVESVINQQALLKVAQNKEGHLDFSVSIVDANNNMTGAGEGYSYAKLLCIAFDLAVLRAHLDENFPRFVFHDGLFENWDDRKKVKLLEVMRSYGDLGLQPIVTLIDSDLPGVAAEEFFGPEEVVLKLHDRDDSGRLFKMKAW